MNSIDFTQAGGLWTYQDTLKFLQDTYSPLLNAITTALGDRIIISGCAVNGSQVAPGWLIYNGELLPLEQSALATNIDVQEANSSEQFNDGTQKRIYKVRKAILTNAAVGVPFSSFKQVKYLSAFLNLPTAASADYSAANDNALATITALFNLKAELMTLIKQFNGVIMVWSGALNTIPTGWQLCDGTNGSPDLRDKFVLGSGITYGIGATGGEADHVLTVDEMPNHAHTYQIIKHGGDYGDNASGVGTQDAQTSSIGGGLAHNNMPPYYSLAYIYRIPIN